MAHPEAMGCKCGQVASLFCRNRWCSSTEDFCSRCMLKHKCDRMLDLGPTMFLDIPPYRDAAFAGWHESITGTRPVRRGPDSKAKIE